MERPDDPLLSRLVEIDQHIPTENHVVALPTGETVRRGEVDLLKTNRLANDIIQQVSARSRLKMPLPKIEHLSPKRVATINGSFGLRQRFEADIHRINSKPCDRPAKIQQAHSHRIRLFTGRARSAKKLQLPIGMCRQPLAF